jgi:hypothetical protein
MKGFRGRSIFGVGGFSGSETLLQHSDGEQTIEASRTDGEK